MFLIIHGTIFHDVVGYWRSDQPIFALSKYSRIIWSVCLWRSARRSNPFGQAPQLQEQRDNMIYRVKSKMFPLPVLPPCPLAEQRFVITTYFVAATWPSANPKLAEPECSGGSAMTLVA